jgi:hypothetical protein
MTLFWRPQGSSPLSALRKGKVLLNARAQAMGREATASDHAGRRPGCGYGRRLLMNALIRCRDRVLGTDTPEHGPDRVSDIG